MILREENDIYASATIIQFRDKKAATTRILTIASHFAHTPLHSLSLFLSLASFLFVNFTS